MNKNDRIKTSVASLVFDNPLMLASGVMGTTPGGLNRIVRAGAGAVVTKSLGPEPRDGHPAPNVIEVSSGYLNAMGLPNPGVDEYKDELKETSVGKPVIASIYGGAAESFAEVARKISPEAAGIELNLSCPHAEKLGAQVGTDPELVEEIVKKVSQAVDIPIFAKLTPNVADITVIGEAAQAGGADGVVAINTLPGMKIDVQTQRPVLGNISGGLSGQAIYPVAVKSVYDLYESLSVPIIGVGGVETVEDLVEMLLAGASAVQVGTVIASRDLEVFEILNSELINYLRGEDTSVSELVGNAHNFS